MKLSFHGAAQEVTGACYLLDTGSERILFDCGLFQGCDECADLNFMDFSFDPSTVDALVVTHAHIDHVGRIPKLVKMGFKGTIYSTPPTRDIAELLLEDALGLAEREHHALYSAEDVQHAFALWRTVEYGAELHIGKSVLHLYNASHILGSAMIECVTEGRRLLFTGDLGNEPSLILPPMHDPTKTEYMIIESAYGNREHERDEERALALERAIEDMIARGGTLMIPAFATERVQDLLFLLNEMLYFKRVPEISVFVDSPLAIRITGVFERYPEYYKKEIQQLFGEHPNLFRFKKLRFTATVDESKAIAEHRGPKIVIAGAGMMNGGRILHHLKRSLPDEHSMLLIVGYQSAGTLGRRLIDGARYIKVLGEDVEVRAELRKVSGFSAHADSPHLYRFVARERDTLKHVFVVQGETASAMHLVQEIKDRLGVPASAPTLHQEVEL